jgi:hypothetical protein
MAAQLAAPRLVEQLMRFAEKCAGIVATNAFRAYCAAFAKRFELFA